MIQGNAAGLRKGRATGKGGQIQDLLHLFHAGKRLSKGGGQFLQGQDLGEIHPAHIGKEQKYAAGNASPEEKQAAYRAEGLSRKRARQAAETYVAPVDASEHQLGLAVDINADTARSSREQVYAWLAAHAHEYGFILRYPADKTEHTGFAYEPWHYRYVGRQAAAEMHAQSLCLEEYLAQR